MGWAICVLAVVAFGGTCGQTAPMQHMTAHGASQCRWGSCLLAGN